MSGDHAAAVLAMALDFRAIQQQHGIATVFDLRARGWSNDDIARYSDAAITAAGVYLIPIAADRGRQSGPPASPKAGEWPLAGPPPRPLCRSNPLAADRDAESRHGRADPGLGLPPRPSWRERE